MIFRILALLLLIASSARAQDALQYSLWETALFKSTPATVKDLLEDMYRVLPRDQAWPEPAKGLLLRIINKHYAGGKEAEIPPYQTPSRCTVYAHHPDYLISHQADVRFLPYAVEIMSTDVLADFGEPALPHMIKALYHDELPGRQRAAAAVIDSMFVRDYPFMHDSRNKVLIRQGLLYVAQQTDNWANSRAVLALRFVKDQQVLSVLEAIRTDVAYLPLVRGMAMQAIQFSPR